MMNSSELYGDNDTKDKLKIFFSIIRPIFSPLILKSREKIRKRI